MDPLTSTKQPPPPNPNRELIAQLGEARTNAVVNGLKLAGLGLITGIAASFAFKRATAPIYLGVGFGSGMGFSEGKHILNNFYLAHPSACPYLGGKKLQRE
jgi:hypothetical protein